MDDELFRPGMTIEDTRQECSECGDLFDEGDGVCRTCYNDKVWSLEEENSDLRHERDDFEAERNDWESVASERLVQLVECQDLLRLIVETDHKNLPAYVLPTNDGFSCVVCLMHWTKIEKHDKHCPIHLAQELLRR